MTLDVILFAVFPYVAVALAVIVGIYRYVVDRFSYSSFSSQFLENRALFFGSGIWHYALLVILLAHIIALLFTDAWAAFIANPTRLYTLEGLGVALGISTVVALAILALRRLLNPRIRTTTTILDWLLIVTLITQVSLGVWVALFYRWGSLWYMYTAVPWLVSLATFSPQVSYIASLPWIVKLHMLGGFVLTALFPFTRLVHLIALPITYLWRPYQVVIWYARRRATS